MTIVRWQPFREMDTLNRQLNQLNRLFDEVISPSQWSENKTLTQVPPAELTETAEEFQLKLEIPGIDPKNLNVEVTQDLVSISGERQEETKSENNGTTRTEFRYGKFQRVISLTTPVQNNNVTAEYKDGILKLTLPKREEAKNNVVKVNIG